jgi:hypothetical protein
VPLYIIMIVVVFAGLWSNSNGEAVNISTAIWRSRPFLVETLLFALDRFFRWKLYWEACRRVNLA